MHPKSFVSNFWGAVQRLPPLTLSFRAYSPKRDSR